MLILFIMNGGAKFLDTVEKLEKSDPMKIGQIAIRARTASRYLLKPNTAVAYGPRDE
jgi:hypothetical protein